MGSLTMVKEANYLAGENRWIFALSKGISIKWNANNLIQDLNSGHQFHIIWW